MINIGINGYGNLGKGVEAAIKQNADMRLAGIFTRREPSQIEASCPVFNANDCIKMQDEIDVMILCGGSATDLPVQGPQMLSLFNTVDSFDKHPAIGEYFAVMNAVGKKSKKLGAVSIGWDPGLFSMNRLLFSAVAPRGKDYTFWGKGVSQGHGDAIRRIEGVANAVQYTVPKEDALTAVQNGCTADFSVQQKHERVCYVVSKEGADLAKIEREIKAMPHYFVDYDTTVNFVSQDELNKNHSKLPHGGLVVRNAQSSNGSAFGMEFSLRLESNPEFTASVLIAFARAVFRMSKEGKTGAVTAFDVPLSYLSSLSSEELFKLL